MKKRQDHINLLCDIGDLAGLLTGSTDIQGFLQQTVELVSRHLDAHVCSIYLYDEHTEELVLEATVGLNPQAVGKIKLKPGDGLVGLAFARLKPVNEGDASHNPRFKYFSEAGEDRFASLLAIPIFRGVERIGVLVVQHEAHNNFDDTDIMALRALASQLAGAIANAQLLMDTHTLEEEPATVRAPIAPGLMQFMKADIGSPGFACAPATILNKSKNALAVASGTGESLTINDFHRAIRTTGDQLKDLQERFAARLPESASLIFSAHFMILKDPKFGGEMIRLIEAGTPPPEAVRVTAQKYIDAFAASPHEYIREKTTDLEDLGRRILTNLYRADLKESIIGKARIVIAREIFPSDILKLASEDVQGIVLVSGSVTSHVTILARSLAIPMLIVPDKTVLSIPENTRLLLDAEIGSLYINPSEKIVRRFELRNEARLSAQPATSSMRPETRTADGTRIQLLANINLLSEVAVARDLNAEGVGLYRTEFPFLIRKVFPSEEEQVNIYRRLLDDMDDRPVTIRTLDVGGDKVLSYFDDAGEANPQLGLRSIRFSLKHRDLFRQQLRAILRAGADRNHLRIMFPMISSLDELREAKKEVATSIDDLVVSRLRHHRTPEIGIMLELPSVVEIIDALVKEVDFLSIGTNDFVQYMLAADRTNSRVADYYQPWHPSVLRGLSKMTAAAVHTGTDISVCGETARDLDYIPFLVGIGVRSLSVSSRFLPLVQQWISEIDIEESKKFAADLLEQTTIKGILEIVASA